MTTQQTIQAKISPKMLDKVTRLFDASIDEILTELFQNARRAGATAIHLNINFDEKEPILTIRDDGIGIADPQDLLSLGESGWNSRTLTREDPAGMGVFSLSTRGATIRSKKWQVTLKKEHFTGSPVSITELEEVIVGTAISFPLTVNEATSLKGTLVENKSLLKSALYYPLPVYLNDKKMWQKAFLADALYVEDWAGVKIGVFHKGWGINKHDGQLNFHGLTLESPLPTLTDYQIRVNIIDAPALELVLPARQSVVLNSFFDQLQQQCLRTTYRYIATLEEHTLSYERWCEAKTLGVNLPEATPKLETFVPKLADFYRANDSERPMVDVRQSNVVRTDVFAEEDSLTLEHCFAQAIAEQPNSDVSTKLRHYTFVRPNPDYNGYSWYETLPSLTSLDFATKQSDSAMAMARNTHGDAVVDNLTMVAKITTQDNQVTSYSCIAPIYLDCGEDYYWPRLDEITIVLNTHHPFTVDTLAALLEQALFEPIEEYDADSYETQQEYFQENANQRSMDLLLNKDAAIEQGLRHIAEKVMLWKMPENRTALLRVSRSGVTIRVLPEKTTV
ncbi:MAG: ATP-binding protein [Cyanobacteria bacterium P01_D01_bin.56]